jgi:LysR family transcriptional regulator, transcription activator of glutamate synthase operon
MDIEWLQSFLVTSRLKSLSKASQLLNISQPALSKQIRNLENYYGVEFFNRSPQGVELTEEGKLFEHRIQPLWHELESLKNDVLNIQHLTSVRIGVLPSLATNYLPQEILKLKKMGIHVEMVVLNTSQDILSALKMDHIDVGILQRTKNPPRTYWHRDLFQEAFHAAIPVGHPLYFNKELRLSDLAEEPLIVHPKQCDIRQSILKAYESHHLSPIFALEVDFGESIVGFVKAGAGIAILPEMITQQINTSKLAIIPIKDFIVNRTLSLIAKKQSVGKKVFQLLKTSPVPSKSS